jgi:hypothetical protein
MNINNYLHIIMREVHPKTGHEGPGREYRYSYTLSLTSALVGWVVNATPRALYPGEGPGTHRIDRRLGGPQGQCGQVRKIFSTVGFDP